MIAPLRPRHLARQQVIRRLIDQHRNLAVEHRDVDIGADALVARPLQCRKRPDHRIHAGREIAERNAGAHRRAAALAGDAHAAGHGLRDDVVGRAVAIRTVLAEA
jgi:hypothetical protein